MYYHTNLYNTHEILEGIRHFEYLKINNKLINFITKQTERSNSKHFAVFIAKYLKKQQKAGANIVDVIFAMIMRRPSQFYFIYETIILYIKHIYEGVKDYNKKVEGENLKSLIGFIILHAILEHKKLTERMLVKTNYKNRDLDGTQYDAKIDIEIMYVYWILQQHNTNHFIQNFLSVNLWINIKFFLEISRVRFKEFGYHFSQYKNTIQSFIESKSADDKFFYENRRQQVNFTCPI